jgi:hypothetical protein
MCLKSCLAAHEVPEVARGGAPADTARMPLTDSLLMVFDATDLQARFSPAGLRAFDQGLAALGIATTGEALARLAVPRARDIYVFGSRTCPRTFLALDPWHAGDTGLELLTVGVQFSPEVGRGCLAWFHEFFRGTGEGCRYEERHAHPDVLALFDGVGGLRPLVAMDGVRLEDAARRGAGG